MASPKKAVAATTGVPRKENELLINGYLYDVNGFKHPGGSIIKFFTNGGDATDSFEQFHLRSARARKMLDALPHRPAPPEEIKTAEEAYKVRDHQAMTKDFLDMTRRLKAEGWFDWSPLHTVYRLAEILALVLGGLYLITLGYVKTGLLVLGMFQGRCGWLMHEAGHWSLTTNIKLDVYLQEMIFGLGDGMSGGWWRSQHNRHHATPQKLGHDVDLETLPLVAFNKKIAIRAAKSPFTKAWLSMQAFLFAPVTCLLVAFSWQFILHPRFIFRTKQYREAFWLALRYALIYLFATRVVHATLAETALAYVFSTCAGGTYIFLNFALSHTHLPTTEAHEYAHWLEYGSVHTININPTYLCNWWMGYLNFQIEHHLFPSMPQYKFVKLSPQVRELFKRHNLKYDVRGYWSAMLDTFKNLHEVGTA